MKMSHLIVFQISSLCDGDNKYFATGHVNQVPCEMIIDTVANVAIIRTNLIQKREAEVISTSPYIALHIVISDKTKSLNDVKMKSLNISFENANYHHMAYHI